MKITKANYAKQAYTLLKEIHRLSGVEAPNLTFDVVRPQFLSARDGDFGGYFKMLSFPFNRYEEKATATIYVYADILIAPMVKIRKDAGYAFMKSNVDPFLESLNLKPTRKLYFLCIALHELGHADTIDRYVRNLKTSTAEQSLKIINADQEKGLLSTYQQREARRAKNINTYSELSISENLANIFMYKNFFRVYAALEEKGLM